MLNDLILVVVPFKPQTVDLISALAVFEKLNVFPWLHLEQQLWIAAIAFTLCSVFGHATGWRRQK